jgi:hypothetical protein
MSVTHIVLFKWTQEPDAEFLNRLSTGFESFRKIPGVRNVTHGPDLGLAANNFHHGLVVEFESADAQLAYRDHPVHRSFVADVLLGRMAETAPVQFSVG